MYHRYYADAGFNVWGFAILNPERYTLKPSICYRFLHITLCILLRAVSSIFFTVVPSMIRAEFFLDLLGFSLFFFTDRLDWLFFCLAFWFSALVFLFLMIFLPYKRNDERFLSSLFSLSFFSYFFSYILKGIFCFLWGVVDEGRGLVLLLMLLLLSSLLLLRRWLLLMNLWFRNVGSGSCASSSEYSNFCRLVDEGRYGEFLCDSTFLI